MREVRQEPVAIVGMGCRFPQANSLQEFWEFLRAGRDAVREVPAQRWDWSKLYNPDLTNPGKMTSRWGGFLDQIDQFDWRTFRMLPREVEQMDPQHRILLEVAWEAFEDAGLTFSQISAYQTSVTIGVNWSDYLRLQSRSWSHIDGYTAMGNASCFAANRLSYVFNLHGPSHSLDAGCTSSLAAVRLACQSLWTGEADLALAGGVNLILSPDSMIMVSKAGLLSPKGCCKTLDAQADGFVRGEGAGILVLKLLSQVQQSDRVYALIHHVALNHNGHTEWISAPNQDAQEALLRNAYSKADINPSEVDYIELHGTGFLRGDTIETHALGTVLGKSSGRLHDCLIGSVKTNIGHLESASGIASMIKVALSLYHRQIPPTLHLQTVNPAIPLHDLHLAVPQVCTPWPQKEGVPVAGVSTISFSGANAHAILSAPNKTPFEDDDQSIYRLLPLSASSQQALYALAEAYQDFLQNQTADATLTWRDICYTASVRRTHQDYRLVVGGYTPQEAVDALRYYLQERRLADITDECKSALQNESSAYQETLKARYLSGQEVDWSELYHAEGCRCVSLPPYTWQRERIWPDWLDREEISTPPEERYSSSQRKEHTRAVETIDYSTRSSVERVLVRLWREVLGLENVSSTESFFELGGHSLLAMHLLAHIQKVFQRELTLRDLLEAPTPLACADLIFQRKSSGANKEEDISILQIEPEPERRYEPFPMTDVQQAYWVGRFAAFEIGNVGNHGYIEVEATGLDLERFNQALQQLIQRHDMLRAVFLPDGQQQVLEQVPPFEIKMVDLRKMKYHEQIENLEQIRQKLDHQVLSVEQWPAFEIWISQLDDEHVRLHLSIESLFVDAWSMNMLIQEFVQLYHKPGLHLPAPTLSFRDYVLAERSFQNSVTYQRSRNYWLERLATLPPAPDLPLAPSREKVEYPHFVHREAKLEKEDWQRLKARAARSGLTPSGVLLAAFAEVITTWSKTPHFSINLSTFNRLPLHPQINEIVGDFTSLLVLAIDNTKPDTFENRARSVQAQLWNDLDHSHYSGIQVLRELAKIRKEGIKAVMPIVFTSLLIQDTASQYPYPWGMPVYCVSQTPQVWLDHQVLETGGDLILHWQSVDAVFPTGLVDAMFDAYSQLLQRLACHEESWSEPVRRLLPDQQYALLVEANVTEAPVSEKLLHSFFFEQAEQRPDHPALISTNRNLTYREMRSGAYQLAYQLRSWGVCPNQLVGVVMEKGWEQVVAVLGILLSGAAYLPIDANLPEERLCYLLKDARVEVVLTQSWFDREIAWPETLQRISVDSLDLTQEDFSPLQFIQRPEDLAYVIYTSGSTGRPKGVMIDHRGAVNSILDINRRFSVRATDRILALSALNFDLSVYDIFGVLAAGGTIVMPSAQTLRDPASWYKLVERERVTIWNSVPALMQLFIEYIDIHKLSPNQSSLRLALLSGDWIPLALPGDLKRLYAGIDVISLGGATEASIWSIVYPITTFDPSWKSIPYGRPMDNQQFFVLNKDLEFCPVWVPGDLYIAGIGLAKGYWGDEEKTRTSFFEHPRTGMRLYRTGDLGRYLPDGTIEFFGREDFQVKVQGHRIELGEIEETLLRHPTVIKSVVNIVEENQGDKRIVAYVVLASGEVEAVNGHHNLHAAAEQQSAGSYILERRKGQIHTDEQQNSLHSHTNHEKNVSHETLQRLTLQFSQTSIRQDVGRSAIDLASAPDVADTLKQYRERLSYRKFLPGPISFELFSAFLGALRQREIEGLPKYLYPSAGGLYPVQTYVYVKPQGIEGIPEGIYYYNPQSYQLVVLSDNVHMERSIHGAINQPIFDESAFSLFLIGDLTAISSLYGDLARDFCLLETGYIGQLLMMTAAMYQIGLCPIGDLDFERVREGFMVGENHVLLHTLLGGHIEPHAATGWSFLPGSAAKAYSAPPVAASKTTMAELRNFLKDQLPEYMIPTVIMELDSLPLTSNGKVDRKNLPMPESLPRKEDASYAEPALGIEKTIAAIWQEVLSLKQVGAHDNFFDIGGNSFLMARAYIKLRQALNCNLSIVEMFFQYPTIHALAEFLTQGQQPSPVEERPDLQHNRVESRKLSIQQQRMSRLSHRTTEERV
jgi:amino acid adenylation domain-containing protein